MPMHSSSSPSVIVSNIDLLRHILLCLPVKSLLVFKSVSKQWLSLISEPIFVHNHFLQNRPSIPRLFLQKPSFGTNPEFEFIFLDGKLTESVVPFETLTFVNDPAGIKIEQSCNGLLCCSSFKSTSVRRTYYIYNPSTKHYKIIRGSHVKERSFLWICSVSIAFNPLKSPHYEAVCIWRNDTFNYQIEIYSSKTASWRVSGCPFPAPNDIFYTSGVFWNGSLHWISLRDSSLYFDIDQELLKTMPMPPIPHGFGRTRIEYFGECKGHLFLIAIYSSSMTHFDILEMETDYTGWNIKYHVDLEALTIAYPGMVRDDIVVLGSMSRFEFSVLLVDEDEEESSSLVLQIPNNKVMSYDLKEMRFKKIHDLSTCLHEKAGSKKYRWFDAYQYKETLASV
ncbi:F-box domain [Macleaya cordata]|uniref:F-box domain n=1 Tax=Macleaya cordata TaxID=56857 RepID=A0A200R942_MACCD|nr:F-box domain [Macleaya cordata]